MNFVDSVKSYWTNYAQFKGRTSRTTFWWTALFSILASIAIGLIFPGTYHTEMLFNEVEIRSYDQSTIESLWDLATLIPTLAISVRRLHDTGRSGANFLFIFLPIVGWIILLMYFLQSGKSESNQYGEATA